MSSFSRVAVGLALGLGLLLGPESSNAAGPPKSKRAALHASADGTKPKSSSAKKASAKKTSAKKGSTRGARDKKRGRRATKGAIGGRARATGKHAASSSERREAHVAALAILERDVDCPPDMVAVAGRVCVDRFETSIVDAGTGEAWSPFYTPDLARARDVFAFYDAAPLAPSTSLELAPALPAVPSFAVRPKATSRADVLPQGYLSADQAEAACNAAGKRLCTESEWLTACKGEEGRDFPYGEQYRQGTCNVFRESHPSFLLHGNAARYHDDPRNHLVEIGGRAFLQKTGASTDCASRWGDDAVMDMVGNLDEWVADAQGVFVGGFYSRGTRSGCYARVSAHVRGYSDYSTGARCCKDPTPAE
ncbi:MAG TPA: SUMF1/EgtB/PvdO family nonheme iron enzyme [Polyangiaceae bacterium]|jgi:hypothetical protein|nr:SUMF1/EgtB/PvdO family nonheme iron enzyme [Polyangiaceae bacterium]